MESKLVEVLLSGSIIVGSIVWTTVKKKLNGRRRSAHNGAPHAVEKGEHDGFDKFRPVYFQPASESGNGQVSLSLQTQKCHQARTNDKTNKKIKQHDFKTAVPPENSLDADVAAVDTVNLREAVKWSVILEKKF